MSYIILFSRIKLINQSIFALYAVIKAHGAPTTIGIEKAENPFFR